MKPHLKQSLSTNASTHSSGVLPQNPRIPVPAPTSQSRKPEIFVGNLKPAEPATEASGVGGVAALKLRKGKSGRPLCKASNVGVGSRSDISQAAHERAQADTSSRRHASMPQSRTSLAPFGSQAVSSDTAPPVPSLNQAQFDIANDRRAWAHAQGHLLPNPGSPPLVDFTRFEDTYRGPRSGTFEGLVAGTKTGQRSVSGGCYRPDDSPSAAIKMKDRYPAIPPNRLGGGTRPRHPASTSTPSTVLTTGGLVPAPASARKPDPRRVLSALEGMLGDEYKIGDYLHAHELLGMHQLDQLDFEERDRARGAFIKTGKLHIQRGEKGVISVLGEPIRTAAIYSSVPVVLSGREHEIPIIVVNTVEELYRTGIYQANLFRHLPNRGRLMELINIYDSEEQPPGSVIKSRHQSGASAYRGRGHAKSVHPGFGAMTSLHLESTPDVCALLTTYISSLREPVLCQFLFNAIWDWCGVADELEPGEHGHATGTGYPASSSFAPRLSSIPLARTYTSPEDATRIATAQLLLHLLPSPHFSLLVYLLAFFSQVALVREENGVGVADLARMYGSRIFGGDAAKAKNTDHRHMPKDGETMMRWFLRRWGPLSDGLFDVLNEASMGLFRRTQARRDSFGKDILSSWSSVNDSSNSKTDEDEEESIHLDGGMALSDAGADMGGIDFEDDDETVLHSLTAVRDRALGKTRRWPETPAAKTTRAGDYFEAGYDMANGAHSARSKLLRAHSISERSLKDLGVNTSEDDCVVSSAIRHRTDNTLDDTPLVGAPQDQAQITNSGSRERPTEHLVDVNVSQPLVFPSNECDQVFSGQLNEDSTPKIITNGTTSLNETSPQKRRPSSFEHPLPNLDSTNGSASMRAQQSTSIANRRPGRDEVARSANAESDFKGSLKTISQLREENSILHNSVWRLEAELAQLRRDMHAANSNGSHDAAALNARTLGWATDVEREDYQSQGDGLNVEDAEAVKIVAEIRKLMAKN